MIMNNRQIAFYLLLFSIFLSFLLFTSYEVWFVFSMECWRLDQELAMECYFYDSFLWSYKDDVEG
jgi:hypothetical protein